MSTFNFSEIAGLVGNILLWAAILLSLILVVLVDSITLMPIAAKIAISLVTLLLVVVRWQFVTTGATAGFVTLGLILMGPLAVWLSQILAYTPPIVDAQGRVVPGSIASLEKIRINGTDQWIVIRGGDIYKPVLLFLSGGPIGSELGWVRQFYPELENDFVVVIWEQPGGGKSYYARLYSQLTVEQYVSDGLALTEILRDRFHQEKIYILCHSWGTILGVKMAQQRPDLFHAYIGTGQMINTTESDRLSYEYAVGVAKQKNDQKAVAAISKYGPPPYSGKGAALKYANYLNAYVNVYDEQSAGSHLPKDFIYRAFLRLPEFGLIDQINFIRGLTDGMDRIYIPQLRDLDLETHARELSIPVYLMVGKYDHNSNAVLAERWFNLLQTPQKGLFLFEHSAHSPCFTEPEKFHQILVEKILADTLLKEASHSQTPELGTTTQI
jgi:pimeloyl-ACP methyl ester carboxylesterase